jgi:phenylalanyl-tRNA synthetase beta chain
VDLIEEVARLRGYQTFPDELRPYRPGTVPDAPSELTLGRIREQLVRAALLEARTLPLGPADDAAAIAVQNPLAADEAHLRSRLVPGLIRRVEHNWRVGERDVRLFEVGTVFKPGTGGLPDEQQSLGIVITGARRPPHWSEGGRAKVPDMDIWDLKRHFELAVSLAAPLQGVTVRPLENEVGWQAVAADGTAVGWAGPVEADAPKWAAPLYGLEVRITVTPAPVGRYEPLPTQPAVVRDISLVVPGGVTAAAVETVLRRVGGALLARLDVLDEYRGAGLAGGGGAGGRGVTWRCTFRDPARTLTDKEVDTLLGRMLGALEGELDVRRREA